MKQAPHTWQVIENLLISYTTSGAISDALWNAFVRDLRDETVTRMICLTDGDIEVTSVQRKRAAEAATERRLPVAVIADSKVVRGMVTAVSWLGVNIKAFSWADVAQALTHLEVTATTHRRALTVIERIQRGQG